MAEQFDVVIIGAGQAGGPLASAFAGAGRRTAVVEREHVGGTCVNVGCTPTKTMIASGRVAYLARRAGDYGVEVGAVGVAMAAVRERKRAMVHSWREGSEGRLRDAGVELIRGEARFSGSHVLTVTLTGGGERELAAATIVINSGARPAPPDLEGRDTVPLLDSTSIQELDTVPGHLLILGGGYVGLEFGQLFRRLGATVTIVQRGPRLLAREDADIADAVAAILREDGIEVLLDTTARSVEGGPGAISLRVATPEGERTLRGTHLLAAAGRDPPRGRDRSAARHDGAERRGLARGDQPARNDPRGRTHARGHPSAGRGGPRAEQRGPQPGGGGYCD